MVLLERDDGRHLLPVQTLKERVDGRHLLFPVQTLKETKRQQVIMFNF